MTTYNFKNFTQDFTLINNIFIDKYMPKARGEYVKVYILALRYLSNGETMVTSQIIASTLHLLETDVLNAWNYFSEEGVIKINKTDNMGNYDIEFLELKDDASPKKDINIIRELSKEPVKELLLDLEQILGRPIHSKEVSLYLDFLNDYGFSPELTTLLVEYCVSKGKNDSRYIERIAIDWKDNQIDSLEKAQTYIKKHEDKWINIRKILKYLGIVDPEVMKPQEEMLTKWLYTYKFTLDMIYKASDICFQNINKVEFRYIDTILKNWDKTNIRTLKDVENQNKTPYKKNNYQPNVNKNSKFNNYTQKEYDMDDLEKKLLGWDTDD
ncbi:MAG: DnaD domain protein [Clostridiaceae bacterium]